MAFGLLQHGHNGPMKTQLQPGPRSPSRRRQGRGPLPTIIAVAALALALWLFLPTILGGVFGTGGGAGGDGTNGTSSAPTTEALSQLGSLEVVANGGNGEAPPYTRAQFGDGWGDLDGDGCNTRNEILARDLDAVQYRVGTSDCVVEAGVLQDPYTGETIAFERGETTSQMVQIDHVVALADAWNAGAWAWDAKDRLQFSNDPLNLLAVDGDANQDKGAATFDAWIPKNESARCDYAARQVAVKYKWNLTVTRAEHDALAKTLGKCPDLSLKQ